VKNNTFGIAVDGTGGINMTIADGTIANNLRDGILATTPSGGAPIGVLVTDSQSVNNAFGARAIGPNVTVRVESSKIAGNTTGLSFSGGASCSHSATTWFAPTEPMVRSPVRSRCNRR
jgi:hypothetical protein